MEVSTNGTTWTYLPPNKFVRGGYSSVIPTANNPRIGASDKAAFSGASDGYQVSVAKLDDYANQDIFIRFRFTTDATGGSITNGGWWLDDVYILTDRTELTNTAVATTNRSADVAQTEGVNAWSSTTAFILGNPAIARLSPLTPAVVDNSVKLNWQAAGEEAVTSYVVERKEAGEAAFSPIGTVSRAADVSNDYSFTDPTVVKGKKYDYRVVQKSNSAKERFTNIAPVDLGSTFFKVAIFPNPASNTANIKIDNPAGGQLLINLFDASGKKIATLKGYQTAKDVLALPVQGLQPGTYWVEVNSDTRHVTLPLIKR